MSDTRTQLTHTVDERQRLYRKDPWSFYPIFLPPCVLKILIVTDGFGSFGQDDFGLSALLDALAVAPGPWVRFEVTTAHRRSDPNADLPNFRFDGHNLAHYDQMWLFGVESRGSEIADREARAIAEFMDGGGGVFATGDHQDLGVAMCGRLPRVRSMRKWHWPTPGPNNEPVAPPSSPPGRLDTLSAGNDPGIQFDDQSDDVPQRITPRLYHSRPWNPYYYHAHPHPLLCGPRGVIRVLPDHQHEGECYEPANLSATLTFDGHQVVEYPGGVAPEVIAWSASSPTPRWFGAIGALDGHRANVGRVVVDATWHHFFNINLIGELGSTDPVKSVGFDASPAGRAAYEDIKAYYRNIAVWLARESSQQCMWWRALWCARWHHQLVIVLPPPRFPWLSSPGLTELLTIGREARDVLGRVAGRCVVHRWLLEYVVRPYMPEWLSVLDLWLPLPDPPPDREFPTVIGLHAEMLLDVLLGATVYAVGARFAVDDVAAAQAQTEDAQFGEVVGEHLSRAARLFATHVGQKPLSEFHQTADTHQETPKGGTP